MLFHTSSIIKVDLFAQICIKAWAEIIFSDVVFFFSLRTLVIFYSNTFSFLLSVIQFLIAEMKLLKFMLINFSF